MEYVNYEDMGSNNNKYTMDVQPLEKITGRMFSKIRVHTWNMHMILNTTNS